MPDNVCQRCQTPLQPSEAGLCMPCFAQFLWEEGWPALEEVMHRTLPADWQSGVVELVTQQFLAAWAHASMRGLAPAVPLHTHVQAAATRWRTVSASLKELRSLAGDLPPPVHLAGPYVSCGGDPGPRTTVCAPALQLRRRSEAFCVWERWPTTHAR